MVNILLKLIQLQELRMWMHFILQMIMLIVGFLAFIVITFLSYKKACKDFERIDL